MLVVYPESEIGPGPPVTVTFAFLQTSQNCLTTVTLTVAPAGGGVFAIVTLAVREVGYVPVDGR